MQPIRSHGHLWAKFSGDSWLSPHPLLMSSSSHSLRSWSILAVGWIKTTGSLCWGGGLLAEARGKIQILSRTFWVKNMNCFHKTLENIRKLSSVWIISHGQRRVRKVHSELHTWSHHPSQFYLVLTQSLSEDFVLPWEENGSESTEVLSTSHACATSLIAKIHTGICQIFLSRSVWSVSKQFEWVLLNWLTNVRQMHLDIFA